MILYNDKLIPIGVSNTIVFELLDGSGFIYLDRMTYKRLCVLSDFYKDTASIIVLEGVNPTYTELSVEYVETLLEALPDEVSYLAYFISLIKDSILEKRDSEESISELLGYLHVITNNIDILKYIKLPVDIRKSLDFSIVELRDYKVHWKELFKSITVQPEIIQVERVIEREVAMQSNNSSSTVGSSVQEVAQVQNDLQYAPEHLKEHLDGDGPFDAETIRRAEEVYQIFKEMDESLNSIDAAVPEEVKEEVKDVVAASPVDEDTIEVLSKEAAILRLVGGGA